MTASVIVGVVLILGGILGIKLILDGVTLIGVGSIAKAAAD